MKTKYFLPALVAAFALTLVVAAPYVVAELGENKPYGFHDGAKMHAKFMGIQVDGFVGSIPITEDTDRQTLKDQVTVSLSEATNGLEVMGGHIGVAVNENGEKYLVWTLVSIDKDTEAETVTATIYIVDAGDSSNTAIVTKEFDHFMMKDKKYHHDGAYFDKDAKWDKFTQPTGNAELDALQAQFVEKMQELLELKNQIHDLRNSQS